MAGNSAIELLPAELIVLVATSVPCFSDVRALAATSTRFREVCVANSSTIDRHVAPRSIPCEPHARGFLELSARCKGDRTWSHILQISRNAAILDKSLCLFEWQMVSNYKPREFQQHCSVEEDILTPTERSRFIRTYYLLWALLRLEESDWPTKLTLLSEKQLHLLIEMCELPQTMGEDGEELDELLADVKGRKYWLPSQKRRTLRHRAQVYLAQRAELRYGPLSHRVYLLPKEDGFQSFFMLWDYYKVTLQHRCTSRYIDNPDYATEAQWWEESEDEEACSPFTEPRQRLERVS